MLGWSRVVGYRSEINETLHLTYCWARSACLTTSESNKDRLLDFWGGVEIEKTLNSRRSRTLLLPVIDKNWCVGGCFQDAFEEWMGESATQRGRTEICAVLWSPERRSSDSNYAFDWWLKVWAEGTRYKALIWSGLENTLIFLAFPLCEILTVNYAFSSMLLGIALQNMIASQPKLLLIFCIALELGASLKLTSLWRFKFSLLDSRLRFPL